MGNGIILRVLDGTELSPQLTSTLEELLPNYKLETFQEKPNYSRSIERRINSLHDAFMFILKAYPTDPKFTAINVDTLREYAFECRQSCDLSKETLENLHKELEKYKDKLIDVLSTFWKWPEGQEIKDSIACLNEAEQYVLMSRGRPDLATLIPMTGSKTEFVLQLDESIPPYYNQLILELEELKTLNFPKTPTWYRELPEYQQTYFSNLKLPFITSQSVMGEINEFILTWENAKKKSPYLSELDSINRNAPPFASWFVRLSPSLQSMVQVLAKDPANIDKQLLAFKEKLTNLSDKVVFNYTLGLIPKIPQWYWSLSKTQQAFLTYVLRDAEKIEDAVSFLSSRHRTLPLPANFAAHSLFKLDNQGEVKCLSKRRNRSAHIGSRDCLDLPQAVQARHCESNLNKVMEQAQPGQYRLLQTLISPIHAVDYIPAMVTDMLPELPPDLELYKIARSAVSRKEDGRFILQHNHPFNIAKRYYYTAIDDSDSLLLLQIAKQLVSTRPGLEDLLAEYEHVLNSPFGSATFRDYDGRELFLTSLEQLIILTMEGYSYGSCVSGKDRKAIELIHTDAMLLYKERYGTWPKYGVPTEEKERINFIEIVTDLYMSRHQQEHAGQNAPGSDGIKTPAGYFPQDIAFAINKRLGSERGLDYDDRLATDNEVKNISKVARENLLPENELLCKLTANQLGEVTCTRLYDALSALINEEKRFQPSKGSSWSLSWFSDKEGSTPTGIKSIRGVIYDENTGKTNTQRLEKIFLAVLSRPESDSSRTNATNSVYDRIRDLLRPLQSVDSLHALAENAVVKWTNLFEESKKENRSVATVAR